MPFNFISTYSFSTKLYDYIKFPMMNNTNLTPLDWDLRVFDLNTAFCIQSWLQNLHPLNPNFQ